MLNIKVSESEINAILVAALLHDIGHGPLSHAFEDVTGINHEFWTKEIIKHDDEMNSVLKSFGDGFDDLVIRYLDHFSKDILVVNSIENLQDVFSELISSQLDADRMDYLIRDAYNTGTDLVAIDLQKIISNMEISRYNGANHLCINEDALANVEQVVLSRYNMYDKVYHTPYKIFTEQLFIRLLERIISNSNVCDSNPLKHVNSLSIEQYLALDDYSIINYIEQCMDNKELRCKGK